MRHPLRHLRHVRPPALGLALLCALPLRAEVNETLHTRWYEADARAHPSLGRALSQASPIRVGSTVYHGYTRWEVRWRFWWHTTADGLCHITRVQTRADGEITLPRLRHATAAQRAKFERYLGPLQAHERGHFELARQAAREIDQGIAGLPPMRDCRALEARANALGHEHLRRAQATERAYDRRTGHGRTQGAWLPD